MEYFVHLYAVSQVLKASAALLWGSAQVDHLFIIIMIGKNQLLFHKQKITNMIFHNMIQKI